MRPPHAYGSRRGYAPSACVAVVVVAVGGCALEGCAPADPARLPSGPPGAPSPMANPDSGEAALAAGDSPAPLAGAAAAQPVSSGGAATAEGARALEEASRRLVFAAACTASDERAVIGAVGDVLLHVELQKQGIAHERGFATLWAGIDDLLARPDLMYANLETPLAAGIDRDGNEVPDPGARYDGVVYTSYPRFNVHPRLAKDLRRSGFDIVSTANNHALDRMGVGVDRTISALKAARLPFTGTRALGDTRAPWHAVVAAGPFRVAFLACTRHVNGRPDPETQVLRCDRKHDEILKLIHTLAADPKIDAVVVTPHWGDEYSPEPNAQQRGWAREYIEAGAAAVVGSHPHVLQPWERIDIADGRSGLAIYSLGNFASHQQELPKRATILALLELRRDARGKAVISGAGWVPLHVRKDGALFFVEAVERVGGPAEVLEHLGTVLKAGNALPADGAWIFASDCAP